MTTVRNWTSREVAALRAAMRLSVRDFAQRLGIGIRTVTKWSSPGSDVVLRPASQALLDAALEGIDAPARRRFEALLGLAESRPETADVAGQGSEVGNPDVHNRVQVTQYEQLGDRAEQSEPQRPGRRSEDIVEVLGRVSRLKRSVDPDIVQNLAENNRHLVARYEDLDHSELVPTLLRQRTWAESLLSDCNDPAQRRQLFEIAGTTSGMLGYIAVGRADFPLARAYCAEAFELGHLAQAANLQAWTRGIQSFCEYYALRYEEALRLALDGLTYSGSGPQSVRLTINGAARALGKLGDVNGVRRAVDSAFELLADNVDPGGLPSSISLDCYSAAQTASNAATAYVSLGIPAEVQRYIGMAMPEIERSGSVWSQSLVTIDLSVAASHEKNADLDRACQLVLGAIGISASRPVVSVAQRASEFVRGATERWGETPQVRQVRALLRDTHA